jgi:UDP-N-acetylglucosamine 1-carboxyvinyltransferase
LDIFVIKGGRPFRVVPRLRGKERDPSGDGRRIARRRPVELAGVPVLRDISTFGKLLGILGAEVSRTLDAAGRETMRIVPGPASTAEAPYDLVKTMRASVLVLGPLLARYGRARISLPGGCAIGARPIDQHLKGLELLGAKTALAEGYIEATAHRLKGAPVHFDMKTVTGTENLMMAAVLGRGRRSVQRGARARGVRPGTAPARHGRRHRGDGRTRSSSAACASSGLPPRGDGGPDRGGDAALAGAVTGGT